MLQDVALPRKDFLIKEFPSTPTLLSDNKNNLLANSYLLFFFHITSSG